MFMLLTRLVSVLNWTVLAIIHPVIFSVFQVDTAETTWVVVDVHPNSSLQACKLLLASVAERR